MEQNIASTSETIGTVKSSKVLFNGQENTKQVASTDAISGFNKDRGPRNWAQRWDEVPNPKILGTDTATKKEE